MGRVNDIIGRISVVVSLGLAGSLGVLGLVPGIAAAYPTVEQAGGAALTPSDGVAGDNFGAAVAGSGSTVVVGASGESVG